MHDPWLDQLSEYMEGTLPPADAAALEEHLAACAGCRQALADLQEVLSLAHSLEAGEPPRDLWAGIEQAITAQAPAGALPVAPSPDMKVIRLDAARAAKPAGARFSFTLPQLAAAAVLLMAVGGTAVYLMAGGSLGGSGNTPVAMEMTQGTIVLAAGAPEAVRQVSATPPAVQRYESEVAELEQALEDARHRLDPATVDVVERSLESIDLAIADARAALAADPANPHLNRKLENTLEKKLAVLSRASGVQRGGS